MPYVDSRQSFFLYQRDMAYCQPLAAVNACPRQSSGDRIFTRAEPSRLQCHGRRLDAFTATHRRSARVGSRNKSLIACCAVSAPAESRSGKIRLIQHKEEAFWFYRFLSIVYDTVVNPGHWTEDMRTDALSVAELNNPNLKVRCCWNVFRTATLTGCDPPTWLWHFKLDTMEICSLTAEFKCRYAMLVEAQVSVPLV